MGRMIMSRIIFACFAFAFAMGGKVIGIITAVSQRMEGGRRAHTRKSDWLVVWVHHGGRAGATHRACIVIYVDHIMIPPISLRRLRSVFFIPSTFLHPMFVFLSTLWFGGNVMATNGTCM
jgi:hypothetical protein